MLFQSFLPYEVHFSSVILQVNMIKDDGTVIHFNNPKVQASLSANTFAITGHAEAKPITEMLPGILSQLGADSLTSLRKLAEQFPRQGKHFSRASLVLPTLVKET